MDDKWYQTLSEENREKLFKYMRLLGRDADTLRFEGARLSPPPGTIAVGGAHFDLILKAEIIDAYLKALRWGHNPGMAYMSAIEERGEVVHAWNKARRDYVTDRSIMYAEQALIETIYTNLQTVTGYNVPA